MKRMMASLFAASAIPALALEPVAWNGFWDTTGYVNAEPAEVTVTCAAPVCLCFSDTVVSDSPSWFETLSPGFLIFLR